MTPAHSNGASGSLSVGGQKADGQSGQMPVRRLLLAGDTTLDPLGRLLERGTEAPKLQCVAAPYGQIFQILLDGSHPAWSQKPDCLVVWTAPQLTLPALGKVMRFESFSQDEALREAEQFADAVLEAASRVSLVLMPSWVLPSQERWVQSLTLRHGVGLANLLARANLLLAEKFASRSNIILLDANYWQASLSRPAYDFRMYAVAKILYSQPLLEKAAAEIRSVLLGSLGMVKKVVVCDLDNTLWGGVVGDDGAQALKLGAPDPVGECFQAFQTALKGLRSRGIVLTVCSKNDEQFALSVIEEHPAMVLRKADFAAWRINWNNKAENLASLAEELNLGLDSFVFLDDSPQEREQVRQMLPQVYTPDLPVSPAELAPFVTSLACFETTSLGREDFERTDMYQAERARKEIVQTKGGAGVEDWLRSLRIEIRAERLQRESLARAAQLLNKTNQFNLRLRRMEEQSFWDWAQDRNNAVYVFQVKDRFGDFGLTGLVSLTHRDEEAEIADFVMSCRVMGKKVEEALLGYVVSQALADGAVRVTAPDFAGPRNGPARDFFAAKYEGGSNAAIDLALVAVPSLITLTEENLAPAGALTSL